MKIKYLKYIPLQQFVELGLSANQILLASAVMSFYKDDKTLRVGYKKLAEATGIPVRTVRRDMATLANIELIIIKSGKAKRNANEYFPTKKLKDLYGHGGHINMVTVANHTPSKEGDNREGDPASLAKQYNLHKEYMSDLELGYDAEKRLYQRLALIQKQNKAS